MLTVHHHRTLLCLHLLLLLLSELIARGDALSGGDTSKGIIGLKSLDSYLTISVEDHTPLMIKVMITMAVEFVIFFAMLFVSTHVYKWRRDDYYKRIIKLNGLVIRHFEVKYGPVTFDD